MKMTGSKAAAVFWIANPLVILVAAIWGQLDPIATLLALGALYYYDRKKPYHAYFLASLGAAVKIWPVLLIPLFLVDSLRKDGRAALKPLSTVALPLAVSLGLYAAYGDFAQTVGVFIYSRGIPTYGGQFSVNGLTWQQALAALRAPPVPIFLVIGIPLYCLILAWTYWKKDSDITKWIVVSILVFYLTYNYVNPQYFYWIIPFLILQRKRVASWLFTALPMAYVALSYNIFYFVSPAILFDEFSNGAAIVDQLKIAYFSSMLVPAIVLVGALPTAAYLLLLRQEIGKREPGQPISTAGQGQEVN